LDMNADRLAFCRRIYNVQHTVHFKGDGSELSQLQAITGGELYPVVIDATGNAASMGHALNFTAHGGTLVYLGITTQEISFPHKLMHVREATIKASRNALPGDFGRIIKLIEERRIDTAPWITHRTSMDKLSDVFDSYTRPETGTIKAMVAV